MPAAMAQMKQGDNLWGIPFSTSPTGIFYNADLFAAAGIPNPDEMIAAGDWTWDNLRPPQPTHQAGHRRVGLQHRPVREVRHGLDRPQRHLGSVRRPAMERGRHGVRVHRARDGRTR